MTKRGEVRKSVKDLRKRLVRLFKAPMFWAITLLGNAAVFGGALLFHWFESNGNPGVTDFLDSLSWAVGMVTTVGGGNIHPQTFFGKTLSIFMMMGGAVFLWSYMALFVGAFVDPDLRSLERDVSDLHHDIEKREELLGQIRLLLRDLEKNWESIKPSGESTNHKGQRED